MLYNLSGLTANEVNMIGQALAELPHKMMWGLNQKLQLQINEQDSKAIEDAKKAESVEKKKKKVEQETKLEIVKD